MRITTLTVNNYKSLRHISWKPRHLSAIVGANASGKSNFADAHDFLSDVYRHGLAVAVARKGGYENIAHRKMRRSRGGISMEVVTEISRLKGRRIGPQFLFGMSYREMRFTHSFEFRAETTAIQSDFRIENERISLDAKIANTWITAVEIIRKRDSIRHTISNVTSDNSNAGGRLHDQFRFLEQMDEMLGADTIPQTELLIAVLSRFIPVLRIPAQALGSMRVFQLSPTDTRHFGVPIPNPEMNIHGDNLPAVVNMIIKDHSEIWQRILDIMRQLLPGLERIYVDYTHSRTLGLYFQEEGVGRPWNVAEISDGTIHSLAFLVALFDPRTPVLFIEEPENSVHTWILRTLMDAAKKAAENKQIILTTHSRIVVDAIEPADLWIMWREQGESNLGQLQVFDEDALDLIEKGDLTTFEILDSGLIKQALPPAPGA